MSKMHTHIESRAVNSRFSKNFWPPDLLHMVLPCMVYSDIHCYKINTMNISQLHYHSYLSDFFPAIHFLDILEKLSLQMQDNLLCFLEIEVKCPKIDHLYYTQLGNSMQICFPSYRNFYCITASFNTVCHKKFVDPD